MTRSWVVMSRQFVLTTRMCECCEWCGRSLRASGANAVDKVVDLALRLLPDLGPRVLDVRRRVVHVACRERSCHVEEARRSGITSLQFRMTEVRGRVCPCLPIWFGIQ